MNTAAKNRLWSKIIADELAKNGVRTICICPGSRNTPLTLAFHDHPEISVSSLLDERSAGFFVLGKSINSGRVVPVVSTSGTATAEFHPAVMEADRAGVPMMVLTADRPPDLRESGANQTVDQTELYGSALRHQRSFPLPTLEPRTLRWVRVNICRAIDAVLDPQPGPAHINLPFQKPLEPDKRTSETIRTFSTRHPVETNGRDGPFVKISDSTKILSPKRSRKLRNQITQTDRGWIVAGPQPGYRRNAQNLIKFSKQSGFLLLADPLSGARFHQDIRKDFVLTGYDGFLANSSLPDPPELILRTGANPTASKTLTQYLGNVDTQQILINPDGDWSEDHFKADQMIQTSIDQLIPILDSEDNPTLDQDWHRKWLKRDQNWWERVKQTQPHQLFEGEVLRIALECLPDGSHCFVSNSQPIRDLNQFVPGMEKMIVPHANRGCSGIDGIVSSAIGVASNTEAPLLAIVGDLAFYHDSNGLLALQRLGINANFLVINNDGGGIFHRLPVKDFEPAFTNTIKTPHGLDFQHLAQQYGCEYGSPKNSAELEKQLRDKITTEEPAIIEIKTDAEWNQQFRESFQP